MTTIGAKHLPRPFPTRRTTQYTEPLRRKPKGPYNPTGTLYLLYPPAQSLISRALFRRDFLCVDINSRGRRIIDRKVVEILTFNDLATIDALKRLILESSKLGAA